MPATSSATYCPGRCSEAAGANITHSSSQTDRRSRAKMSGSPYHEAGSVRATAATVLSRIDDEPSTKSHRHGQTVCAWPAASYFPRAPGRSPPCWRRCPTGRTTSRRRTEKPTTDMSPHGFAVLRLDLRGTGSSAGVMTDEYPDVERRDLRRRSSGSRNSRGRAAGSACSARRTPGSMPCRWPPKATPTALGAVVAMYATDDRYTDDVHWCGGVLRAIDLVDYPLYMIAMNALPPVPALAGDGWRETLAAARRGDAPVAARVVVPSRRRADVAPRLDRRRTDGAGYERMSCPTMLIAGWADGYRNNTFRVIEQYGRNGLPWRLVAGPWGHRGPHHARPGPTIDDAREILAFFDEHLRDGPPSAAQQGAGLRAPRRSRRNRTSTSTPVCWRDVRRWPDCWPASADMDERRRWLRTTGGPWRRGYRGVELVYRLAAVGPATRPARGQRPVAGPRLAGRRSPATCSATAPCDCGCAATGATATSAPSCVTCSPTGRRHWSPAACSTSPTAVAGRSTRRATPAPARDPSCPASGSTSSSTWRRQRGRSNLAMSSAWRSPDRLAELLAAARAR